MTSPAGISSSTGRYRAYCSQPGNPFTAAFAAPSTTIAHPVSASPYSGQAICRRSAGPNRR